MADMIEIRIGNANLTSKLKRLAAAGRDQTPAMREASGILADAVEENFEQEGRPKWKSLAKSTIKQREKEGKWPGKILQRSGSHGLAGSITRHHDANSAVVGTNKKYAAIQNFGGKAGRGHKVDIPAREFLHLEPEDEEDLAACFAKFLAKAVE
ncbi:MAG: phage virion morphogenesis protein [Desulfovibrionaceae bacterium]